MNTLHGAAVADAPEFSLHALFATIDAMDANAFAELLHPQAQFRFGNGDMLCGREAIRDYVQAFFNALGDVQHRCEETLLADGQLVCHGQVRYTRKNGSTLQVPFLNLLGLRDGLIGRYLIFIDNSALFTATG